MNAGYYEEELLENKTFSSEILQDIEFVECSFVNCDFSHAQLDRVSFTNCDFKKCHFDSPQFSYCELRDGVFFHCSFIGIQWEELKPSGRLATILTKMENCTLKYNNFVNIPLDKVSFTESTIIETMFADCSLKSSSFQKANLSNTEFFQCDLRKSNFQQAVSYTIDVKTCQLKDAKFSMPEVLNLLDTFQIKID